MTPEEEKILMAAVPSWVADGRGLFPDYKLATFPPSEPAEIIRTQYQNIEPPPLEENPTPPNPAEPTPTCPMSGTVMVVFSAIASCGCVESPGITPASLNVTAFSGLNGAHTLTWDAGTSTFILSGAGSYTLTSYSDFVCGTVDGTTSGNFDIVASCSGGNWQVTVSNVGLGNVFLTTAPEPMGSAITNSVTCSGGFGGPLLAGGSATVS